MRTPIPAGLVLAAALGLSGCAGGTDVFGEPGAGYVGDVAAELAAADWTRAEEVTVALSEFRFEPATLVFQAGGAYRLRIENSGNVTHYFASESFFKAIAVKELRTPAGEVDRPYLRSIAVTSGEAKELDFVPVRKGVYRVECTVPFHATFGMVAEIRIE